MEFIQNTWSSSRGFHVITNDSPTCKNNTGKKASDVSSIMFIVLLVGNSPWIYYGLKKSDIPHHFHKYILLGAKFSHAVVQMDIQAKQLIYVL